MFIVFEGIDGSGKDTQLHIIAKHLKDRNKYCNVWVTREPTKITKSGKKVSQLLKTNITKNQATKYFIQDRKEHSIIIKDILNHSHVLSSRYDLSTYAYQITQGMDFDTLYKLHNYDKEVIIPDITFVFNVNIDTAIDRIDNRNEDIEVFEKKDFLLKTINNYNSIINRIIEKDNRKIIIIDANQSVEKVTKDILQYI